MRERWVGYFLNVVGAELPVSWYETVQPNLDSTEQELANLHAVLQYCADTQRRDVLIEMAFRLNKLWSIRGYYEDRHRFVELALCAAEHERKVDQQVKLLCIQARTLCYLNKLQQALEYCARAQTLLLSLPNPSIALEQQINYSLIRAYLLLKNYEPIRDLAERHIALSSSAYTKIGYSYDVAEYYSAVGRQDDAVRLQQEALEASVALNDRLGILRGSLLMAKSEMEHGQLSHVEDHLRIAESTATEIDYRRFSAEVAAVYARLHMLRGDLPAAHGAFAKATDLFERLGLRRELDTMREELATLSGHLGIQNRE
jgi:tetratricopeptide (TPR) repeat protein